MQKMNGDTSGIKKWAVTAALYCNLNLISKYLTIDSCCKRQAYSHSTRTHSSSFAGNVSTLCLVTLGHCVSKSFMSELRPASQLGHIEPWHTQIYILYENLNSWACVTYVNFFTENLLCQRVFAVLKNRKSSC